MGLEPAIFGWGDDEFELKTQESRMVERLSF